MSPKEASAIGDAVRIACSALTPNSRSHRGTTDARTRAKKTHGTDRLAVESGDLENRWGLTASKGSNPSPSVATSTD